MSTDICNAHRLPSPFAFWASFCTLACLACVPGMIWLSEIPLFGAEFLSPSNHGIAFFALPSYHPFAVFPLFLTTFMFFATSVIMILIVVVSLTLSGPDQVNDADAARGRIFEVSCLTAAYVFGLAAALVPVSFYFTQSWQTLWFIPVNVVSFCACVLISFFSMRPFHRIFSSLWKRFDPLGGSRQDSRKMMSVRPTLFKAIRAIKFALDEVFDWARMALGLMLVIPILLLLASPFFLIFGMPVWFSFYGLSRFGQPGIFSFLPALPHFLFLLIAVVGGAVFLSIALVIGILIAKEL